MKNCYKLITGNGHLSPKSIEELITTDNCKEIFKAIKNDLQKIKGKYIDDNTYYKFLKDLKFWENIGDCSRLSIIEDDIAYQVEVEDCLHNEIRKKIKEIIKDNEIKSNIKSFELSNNQFLIFNEDWELIITKKHFYDITFKKILDFTYKNYLYIYKQLQPTNSLKAVDNIGVTMGDLYMIKNIATNSKKLLIDIKNFLMKVKMEGQICYEETFFNPFNIYDIFTDEFKITLSDDDFEKEKEFSISIFFDENPSQKCNYDINKNKKDALIKNINYAIKIIGNFL